jgi:hypothetical protein
MLQTKFYIFNEIYNILYIMYQSFLQQAVYKEQGL